LLLLNDYAMRLVHFMEKPENCRVAVAQTPYSALPGAPNLIERIAGATTDIQHIIHQGFTSADATYWVGANALLRRRALDDIVEVVEERGYRIQKYIQDRTVIEDTESSIDLVARGWTLYNYPARLAYSATPPDFGALVIQRRRWANGGLIILPKLLRYLNASGQRIRTAPEALMRVHYLTSLTGVSLGMVILLGYPFEQNMRSWWLVLTALPYYLLYGRDLVRSLLQRFQYIENSGTEGVGFEPTRDFHPCRFSRPVPSTTRPPLHAKVTSPRELDPATALYHRADPPYC
jgi:cellulose synthase (UDP-forming)